MRITTEKVEELRIALGKVGFSLLEVRERLTTEIGYNMNSDGSLKSNSPDPWCYENTYITLDVFPLSS